MSTSVTFFIFICVTCLVVGYNDIQDEENPWDKVRQLQIFNQNQNQNLGIRNRFNNGAIRGRNSICTGTTGGAQVQGVCRPLKECLLRGGSNAGRCPSLGTCCVFTRTCTNTTNAKLTYFVNPATFQSQCSLTVNLLNRDVCQIRLDFDDFNIAQPTALNPLGNSSFQCNVDQFTVTSGNQNLGFPHLCGDNTRQHIYIPVNGTQGTNSINLNFQLSGDRNTTNLQQVNPTWRIRVKQLECATLPTDFNNIQSYLQNMVQRLQNHKNNNIQLDAAEIAPAGCLQYYTDRTGTYESFNYNGGRGYYIGNTNYAICFRRTQDICGIRHTPVMFNMNFNVDNTQLVCRSADTNGSNDYLQIPGGVVNGTPQDFFCDSNFNTTVTSSAPGPLYVAVRTDDISGGPIAIVGPEFGFRINYALLSTGC